MKEAVLRMVTSKFGEMGTYSSTGARPWTDARTSSSIGKHEERAVEATIAFCAYVMRTYGRFPAHTDAFKTVVAFQAHHLDLDFYDTFYPNESVPQAHRDHLMAWHQGQRAEGSGLSSLQEGVRP